VTECISTHGKKINFAEVSKNLVTDLKIIFLKLSK